ncbi:LacI family repressor for deo operon, udp, cdd, tsx, nupC, and nupG [Salibacterium salarium]|uniref:LacI family DNA-binding transcriptional regulator n=1 Tax=Salibacterium salarium TaxID=284579 RepID=UPI002784176A|nr:LacI family DNA-binding transcriptional regulator [Salibacterium salarium]MDQ0297945.1 LacI family repressor for deo operon, udp, cdd, tsx, nupC, and nupG [Salibacterium salarium]
MPTIKDVAKQANVSVATVSRVLSKADTVSEKNTQSVLEAVEKLNYKPNALGRYLRTAHTKTILVVVPDITNPFFSNVMKGIQTLANEREYDVLVMDAEHAHFDTMKCFDMLEQKQVDGLIMLTSRFDQQTLIDLSAEHSIVLACEYLEGTTIPTVSIDNVSAARKMTEYLIDLAYTNIAHITGPMETVLGIDRLRGFKQALQARTIPVKTSYIQEGDFSVDSGYNVMFKLLAMEDRPDAVFAANDEMAMGAINAAKAFDLKVPEDIAIVGFDDIRMASMFTPQLTTVSQPTFDIGQKSMSLLLDLLNKEPLTQSQFVLENTLMVRDSCGHHLKTKHDKESPV